MPPIEHDRTDGPSVASECVYCGLSVQSLLEEGRGDHGSVVWRCRHREACEKRRSGDEAGLVHATWSRKFLGFQILAFADHSYLIDIGRDHKPPLIVLGWYRWRPNSIEFKRWGWRFPPLDED